ncbi:MAG: PTS mannose/fructose/sorbose/N-acetylgalactosamine transporter subunit IIC [Eubacteriaceae bacterium]|jgi:PTS system N-acetylgalactosamine-specific IIC component
MDYSFIQILLVFLVTFVAAIDQFSFLESLYQPIVMGPVIGLILGDVQTGLIVGGTYQLMTIGNMPVGGAQPPNAVIGGIMATILAITLHLQPTAAVAVAIPFSLLGQYTVTLIFTLMSPVMTLADNYAHEANPKGIVKINYLAMLALGAIFGLIVTLFFIGGATFGETVVAAIPTWLMNGLSAAGGMMRYVGFAILLKVMVSKDMWGFYLTGFGLACIVMANESLSGSALVILAFIGFGLAFWDYQIQSKMKTAHAVAGDVEDYGDEEDGI